MRQPVRLCMIGAGRVGKNHSRAIVRGIAGARIVALVDPVEQIRQQTATEFGIQQQFASLEEALDQADFDAVVITTPTPTHMPLAATAAGHKKHVFLEKPMALNLQECDEILAAVERESVLLQLGFMRRFDPEFVAAARRIEAGEIGQPMMIKSNTHGPGLPPAWARDLRTSNGMLAEVNSHDWDTTRWLMGSDYERVYTEVANFKGTAHGVEAEHFYDNALVNLKFESGGLGLISGVCPCGYGYDARVEVIGERGIMLIGSLQGQDVVVCTDRDHGLITPIYRTWPERFEWGYINELQHFVTCIQDGERPRVGGVDGRWAVAGVLAGTKSFLEERPVYLKEILGNGTRKS
ncbi:MAG TPA: Gfo/Idh/MocA family oxidoreductase [Anaerolineales bacterium]|nr:Gfo/Idh/MocA family oxidoreductase [Anaerolineales bacterium]